MARFQHDRWGASWLRYCRRDAYSPVFSSHCPTLRITQVARVDLASKNLLSAFAGQIDVQAPS